MKTDETTFFPTVLCQTPTPNKQPTSIPKWKYDALRSALLQVIPKDDRGVLFTALPGLVAPLLTADEKVRLGSFAWHITTVKLDMETRGEIKRVAGAKPQCLVRC